MAGAHPCKRRRAPEPSAAASAAGGARVRPPLDQLLGERGLAPSLVRAQAVIMAGLLWSGEVRLDKPGQSVATDIPITVRTRNHPWVSRGGVKLSHALESFAIDHAGCIAFDVSASTGGFTDVLLSKEVAHMYSVDVGQGWFDWKLRQDIRVVVL